MKAVARFTVVILVVHSTSTDAKGRTKQKAACSVIEGALRDYQQAKDAKT